MNEAKISSLHVSQNIPQKSPMEVTMENAADNQIHLSQSVPMSSPLTWKLTGDIESNQISVSQNAADSASPLDCSPECPQEEYVYDYQYAGSADHNNIEEDLEYNAVADYDYTDHASDVAVTGGDGDVEGDVGGGGAGGGGGGVVCPGGDLYTCIDVCPGQFGARVFGLCVATCGR